MGEDVGAVDAAGLDGMVRLGVEYGVDVPAPHLPPRLPLPPSLFANCRPPARFAGSGVGFGGERRGVDEPDRINQVSH